MPLLLSELSVLAYANNFTLWHYTTPDASVATANYFNFAADMMQRGDLIIANQGVGGTPTTKFYIVTAISAGVVTVAVYT